MSLISYHISLIHQKITKDHRRQKYNISSNCLWYQKSGFHSAASIVKVSSLCEYSLDTLAIRKIILESKPWYAIVSPPLPPQIVSMMPYFPP